MQVPLPPVDLQGEEIGLLEGLHELLLVLQLLHFANLDVEDLSQASRHRHCLAVLVKLDLAHRRCHNRSRLVHPVQCEEGRKRQWAAIVADLGDVAHDVASHHACGALKGELFDLERHESPLFALRCIEDGSRVPLEGHWVLHLVEQLVVQRVVLIGGCCRVGCGSDARGHREESWRLLGQLEEGASADNHILLLL